MTPEWESAYKATDAHYEVCEPCYNRSLPTDLDDTSSEADWVGMCDTGTKLYAELKRARNADPSFHVALWENQLTGEPPRWDEI